ncbi:unnamed protein product, partial [Choristocarpus tenellus]
MKDKSRLEEVKEAEDSKERLISIVKCWRVPFLPQEEYVKRTSVKSLVRTGVVGSDGRIITAQTSSPLPPTVNTRGMEPGDATATTTGGGGGVGGSGGRGRALMTSNEKVICRAAVIGWTEGLGDGG